MRKILTYFKTSTTAKERLQQIQVQMDHQVKLIIMVETCSNSTSMSLYEDVVAAGLAMLNTDLAHLTANE